MSTGPRATADGSTRLGGVSSARVDYCAKRQLWWCAGRNWASSCNGWCKTISIDEDGGGSLEFGRVRRHDFLPLRRRADCGDFGIPVPRRSVGSNSTRQKFGSKTGILKLGWIISLAGYYSSIHDASRAPRHFRAALVKCLFLGAGPTGRRCLMQTSLIRNRSTCWCIVTTIRCGDIRPG